MRVKFYLSIVFICCVMTGNLFSQETLVVGHVYSHVDKSPLPHVNIYFEGTKKGVESNEDGFFMIRHQTSVSTLVFSSVGFRKKKIKIQAGSIAELEVYLREDVNVLQELFVLPGVNPALDMLKRIRLLREKNDIYNYDYSFSVREDDLVLLQKSPVSQQLFHQLKAGIVEPNDTTHFLPLFVSESQYLHQGKGVRNKTSNETVATPQHARFVLEKLVGELNTDINVYNNHVVLLGKKFISPLSAFGNSYYRYFLIDSISTTNGKTYKLRFRSRNRKNLAFNGEMGVDSATLALTKLSLELPRQANINYVHNLQINKTYKRVDNQYWLPDTENIYLQMTYQLLTDSMHVSPEIIFLKETTSTVLDSVSVAEDAFAGSSYTREDLELKLAKMNNLPIIKTARWIADAVITGYMQAGIMDIGKLYQLARLTDIEGFRFSLPFRTNESLWENISIGGYWGYGLRDKQHKYSVSGAFKLPFANRTVLEIGYLDDLRRIDYHYNDVFLQEKPLLSGDEDIGNTIFSLRSSNNIHPRNEFYVSIKHDWSDNIESSLMFRKHEYKGNAVLPFEKNGVEFDQMNHHYVTFSTRFSMNERVYEDHLERIYIQNYLPVFYLTAESGRIELPGVSSIYGKLETRMRHNMLFDLGQWNYSLDAGWVFGNVPYNLLATPAGSRTLLYKRYQFNLMNYREYVYDKYIAMHHEWILNGLLFNSIPGIKHLNLREMFSFKFLYGGLRSNHSEFLDFPTGLEKMYTPYMEIGAGFTNILRIFSIQSIWRLSDLGKVQTKPWGVVIGIRFQY